jgi:hypothetical protein
VHKKQDVEPNTYCAIIGLLRRHFNKNNFGLQCEIPRFTKNTAQAERNRSKCIWIYDETDNSTPKNG